MSTTNYPSATPSNETPKRDSKNLIIGLLAVGILGTWGYFLWDKNQSDQQITQLQTQYVAVDSSKTEIEKSYGAAVSRLDSLTGYNNELEGKLTEKNSEIKTLRGRIDGILRKQRLTEKEKKEAQALINELNEKISNMEQEVARLTAENGVLTEKNTTLTTEKEKVTQELATTTAVKTELEGKVDVASTLNAYGISITPVDERKSGKEKVTAKAKRVDKLVIAFDVDNRIVATGPTEVYVSITGPDGQPIAVEALGSGKFTTREEGEKLFTTKVPVDFEAGKKKHVEFAWKQNSDFKTGDYKIEIYHNGFKIGEGVRTLKKGGIFG
ncbi:zinc ribbon domain-containing protein [Flavitalea antarctica]